MSVTVGESKPIIYELMLSASELDVILIKLEQGGIEGGVYGETQKKLIDYFKKLQDIRSPSDVRLVRYGIMDSSRLNWE